MWNLFKRNPTSAQSGKAEKTFVYCRHDGRDNIPARHWESEVIYDAWGTPFIYGDSYSGYDRSILTKISESGRIPGTWVGDWRHKSGPQVDFNKADPSKSWFPPNPNDNIPL